MPCGEALSLLWDLDGEEREPRSWEGEAEGWLGLGVIRYGSPGSTVPRSVPAPHASFL